MTVSENCMESACFIFTGFYEIGLKFVHSLKILLLQLFRWSLKMILRSQIKEYGTVIGVTKERSRKSLT